MNKRELGEPDSLMVCMNSFWVSPSNQIGLERLKACSGPISFTFDPTWRTQSRSALVRSKSIV